MSKVLLGPPARRGSQTFLIIEATMLFSGVFAVLMLACAHAGSYYLPGVSPATFLDGSKVTQMHPSICSKKDDCARTSSESFSSSMQCLRMIVTLIHLRTLGGFKSEPSDVNYVPDPVRLL